MLTRIKNFCKFVAASLCLAFVFNCAYAETARENETYAEGMAAIVNGNRDAARQGALNDALNNASLSLGANVRATENLNAVKVPIESLQIRPAQLVTRYSILREWEDQDVYHVALSAVGGVENPSLNTSTVNKKITFTQFHVENSLQVDDINNIYEGLPIELSRRLEAGGGFLVKYVSGSIPKSNNSSRQMIAVQVARQSGSQFVVSGRILDAGVSEDDSYYGALFGKKNSRSFQIEFDIHDGLTGVQLLTHREAVKAHGDVIIGDDKPFGSISFYGTTSGRALDDLMLAATNKIRAALACLPFSANIVRIEGKSVYLDAGGTSMLKVGDKLALYSTDFQLPVFGAGGAMLGVPEKPVATVTLNKIQPQHSIGELQEDASKIGVKTGGIARFEFVDKGNSLSNCF